MSMDSHRRAGGVIGGMVGHVSISDFRTGYQGISRPCQMEEGVRGDIVWPRYILRARSSAVARRHARTRMCPLFPLCRHNGLKCLCYVASPQDFAQLSMAARSHADAQSCRAALAWFIASQCASSRENSFGEEMLSDTSASSVGGLRDNVEDESSTASYADWSDKETLSEAAGSTVPDFLSGTGAATSLPTDADGLFNLTDLDDTINSAEIEDGLSGVDEPVCDERWPTERCQPRRSTLLCL